MMMLNKDEKFENVKRKWRFGWRKIEAHWVHKSWVFRIQTNVENFEKNWKIFSVHLSAENNPENGPRRTIRYQELSELFGKIEQNCFELNFRQSSENDRLVFRVRPIWIVLNRSQSLLHIKSSGFPKIYGSFNMALSTKEFGLYFRGY